MTRRARRRELGTLAHAATAGPWEALGHDGGYLLTGECGTQFGVMHREADALFVATAHPDLILRILHSLPVSQEAVNALRQAAPHAQPGNWVAADRWDAGPFGVVDVTALDRDTLIPAGSFLRAADAAYIAAIRPDELLEVLF